MTAFWSGAPMSLILYSFPVIAVALLIAVIVLVVHARDRATRRSAAAGDLTRTGLKLTGDPLDDFSLRGHTDGKL